MPRATLTFDLPDERAEFDAARAGMDLACNLERVREAIRQRLKYARLSAATRRELEELREVIDHGLLDRVLF